MSKIIIIGAGVSGLSLGQMLNKKHDVTIFESASKPGGLIKCDRIEGNLFHRTGGHVFNTKREDVLGWFWSIFNKEEEFKKANRNAVVAMSKQTVIPYPIENHIHLMEKEITLSIIKDLLNLNNQNKNTPRNFEEFLQNRFGKTLYEIYFKPYNEKIWKNALSNIPISWLDGKLPMPSIEEILYNNIKRIEEKKFVHSTFYYPKKNGSQFIADKLATGLNIKYNTIIDSIIKKEKWIVNGIEADKVFFCGNIKQIPSLVNQQIDIEEFIKPIKELEYHGTTTVFCEIEKNPYSWIYMPSNEYRSHRIICTGNFSENNNSSSKMTATIEFTDEISKNDIESNLEKIPFNPRYLAHHYEKYTYPIQNKTTREIISRLKTKMAAENFFLLGRFAEWEYYNMDAAMGAALELSSKL